MQYNKTRHAAKWPMCDSKRVTDQRTDRLSDGVQELLEWPLATKNSKTFLRVMKTKTQLFSAKCLG